MLPPFESSRSVQNAFAFCRSLASQPGIAFAMRGFIVAALVIRIRMAESNCQLSLSADNPNRRTASSEKGGITGCVEDQRGTRKGFVVVFHLQERESEPTYGPTSQDPVQHPPNHPRTAFFSNLACRFSLMHVIFRGAKPTPYPISQLGVGMARGYARPQRIPVGQVVDLTIVIGGQAMAVKARCAHHAGRATGFQFTLQDQASVQLSEAIERYFAIELEGLQLKSVPTNVIQAPERGVAHWWVGRAKKTGDRIAEIYWEEEGEDELRSRIFMPPFRQLRRAASLRRLKFGVVLQNDNEDGPINHRASDLIEGVPHAKPELILTFTRFMESINGISSFVRSHILAALADQEEK